MKKGNIYTRTFSALAAATMIFNAVTPAVFADEFTEDGVETVMLETASTSSDKATLATSKEMTGTIRKALENAARVQEKDKIKAATTVSKELGQKFNADVLTSLDGMLSAETKLLGTKKFETTLNLNIDLDALLSLKSQQDREDFRNIADGVANIAFTENQLASEIGNKELKIKVKIPQGISYGYNSDKKIDAKTNVNSKLVKEVSVTAGTEVAIIVLKLNPEKTINDFKNAISSETYSAGNVTVSLPVQGTYTNTHGKPDSYEVSAVINDVDLFDLKVSGTGTQAYFKLKQDANKIGKIDIMEKATANQPSVPEQPGKPDTPVTPDKPNQPSTPGNNGSTSGTNRPSTSRPNQKPSAGVKLVEMHRLFNPKTGEHLYTADVNEKNVLSTSHGWNYEGIGWLAPEESATPVYRVYNPNSGDHHYTTDKNEYDTLQTIGWKGEGIGWYSDDNKTVEVHRLYNPNLKIGTHHYTQSVEERDQLVAGGQWKAEGLAWHAR